MTTVQTSVRRAVHFFRGNFEESADINLSPAQLHDIRFFRWVDNTTLLVGDGPRIWRVQEGLNPVLIVDVGSGFSATPAACGRYVIFALVAHNGLPGTNIWRANDDGSNPTQMTKGHNEHLAACSPDQKWIYFRDGVRNQISRILIDGSGQPETVVSPTDNIFISPGTLDISAERKLMTFGVGMLRPDNNQPSGEFKVALAGLVGPAAPQLLDANQQISWGPQFVPGTNTIAYPIREHGVDNVWFQPLDGSPGRQVTHFDSEQIGQLRWSPDGKYTAMEREHVESDLVVLQEVRR